MLIPALLILVLLGVGTLLLATTVQRVGTRAHCRRCHYDIELQVSGNDPGGCCPECGSDLNTPRALVRGQRVVRTWRRWTGVALILIGLSGPATWVWFGTSSWIPFLPSSALAYLIEYGSFKDALASYKQLKTRHTAGTVSDFDLLEACLAMHGRPLSDPNRLLPYGPFMASQFAGGHATEAQAQRLLLQVVESLTFEVGPDIRTTGVTPLRTRLRKGVPRPLTVTVAIREVRGDSGTRECWALCALTQQLYGSGVASAELRCEPWPSGAQHVAFYLESKLLLGPGRFDDPDSEAVTHHTSIVTRQITAHDTTQVQPLPRGSEIRNTLPREVGLQAGYIRNNQQDLVAFAVNRKSSVPYAFKLYVRTDKDFRLPPRSDRNDFTSEAGVNPHLWNESALVAAADAGQTVDLLLVPCIRLAESTFELRTIWPTALLYTDVPMLKQEPAEDAPWLVPEIVDLEQAAELIGDPDLPQMFDP